MLLSQISLTLFQAEKGMYPLIAKLMKILVLIGIAYVNIREMFRGRMSLTVLLLLLMNSTSVSKSELMYISLILNIRLDLIHLHEFQLLVLLLPYEIETTSFFVPTE